MQYGALQCFVWVVKTVFVVMAYFVGVCVGLVLSCVSAEHGTSAHFHIEQ